jgi:hypothetical protein
MRLGHIPIQSSTISRNNDCIDLETFNQITDALKIQHLEYIQTKEDGDAINIEEFINAFGETCKERFNSLKTSEIKTELFGDIQTIFNSMKLREYGGVSFDHRATQTLSSLELSLHLRHSTTGSDRVITVIYELADGKIVHYNDSGTDKINRKVRRWPFRELFGLAVKAAGSAF